MITVRPTLWRRKHVIYAVVIGGVCLIPLVFQFGSFSELMGVGVLAALALMFWLGMRPARLEITETEVRRREGWTRAPLGRKEVLRSEIRSIHYLQRKISFQGADGQPLMDTLDSWTVADMMKAAEELRVPLYDDRVGVLSTAQPGQGRLMCDPVSGSVDTISWKQR